MARCSWLKHIDEGLFSGRLHCSNHVTERFHLCGPRNRQTSACVENVITELCGLDAEMAEWHLLNLVDFRIRRQYM